MGIWNYQLLNVFAESPLGGNPLCVVEQAEGLSDAQMQALALQFNLSETVFLLSSEQANAHMRIFTPGAEMAFAGHPSIGSAAAVSRLQGDLQQLTLACRAGLVPLDQQDGIWYFSPPKAAEITPVSVPAAEMAAALGLQEEDLAAAPVWVNTGSDQVLVALKSTDALQRAWLDAAKLACWPRSSVGRRTVFLFVPDEAEITARYFFERPNGGTGEDPATGSACANLGAWLQHFRPAESERQWKVWQGAQAGRPSCLYLQVSPQGQIRVGGKVVFFASGSFTL